MLLGILEVAYSDEYFLLAKKNWNLNLISKEQTLLRVYDDTHELCLVTRFDNQELTYFFLFGTYEHKNNTLYHNVIFDKQLSSSAFLGKTGDKIFEIVCQSFGDRKSFLLQGGKN